MGKSKMFGGDEPTDDGSTPSPRTTIVGGRPPEDDTATLPVPTGIQSLLRLASVDEAFRQQLTERRVEAAEAANVELSASERAILAAIPASQLEQMSTMMPEPPSGRREFLQRTAAGAVVMLGGAALSACDACTLGSRPDVPPPRPDQRDTVTAGGAAPDEPPRPDRVPSPPGGARPDEPPPPPDPTLMPAGVRPDVPPETPPVRPDRPAQTRGIRPDRPKKKSR